MDTAAGPLAEGGRGPNPLSLFNRWKVFDNLRRSLVPAASLVLLLVCWLVFCQGGWAATVVVVAQLFFHSLTQPLTWAATGQNLKGISPGRIVHDLLRVLTEAAMLPYQAWLTLDAIVRVLYRRTIYTQALYWSGLRLRRCMERPGQGSHVPAFNESGESIQCFGRSVIVAMAAGELHSGSALAGASGLVGGYCLAAYPPAAGRAAVCPCFLRQTGYFCGIRRDAPGVISQTS